MRKIGKINVGIVGAGCIGRSVAVDCILHNLNVILIDISDEILEQARNEIITYVRIISLSNSEQYPGNEDLISKNLKTSVDLNVLKSCAYVIENVPEIWHIKEKLYRQLENACNRSAYIFANTSCTPVGKIASVTSIGDRIVGLHFMNPSYLKPVVEVIPSAQTSEACLNGVENFLKLLNKRGIYVKDVPGFVSNRISHLFINESAAMVLEQGISPRVIDDIFKNCFGHQMGPLETADLIGLDTVMYSLNVLYQYYGDEKYNCCDLIRQMVANGHLGRKSGQGFYKY